MISDRQQQRLLLKGEEYTSEEISQLIAEGTETHSPAYWGLYLFLNGQSNDSPVTIIHASGSTGMSKELMVRKDQMMRSARLTYEFLSLKKGESTLPYMNLRYIDAMMVVVRSLVTGLNLTVCPTSGYPLADIKEPLRFVATVPLQVYNILQVPEEKERLKQTDIPVIGGEVVNEALETEINHLPTAVYSTYGMTETLSHIALRYLSGVSAPEHYCPFPSVKLSLSAENTLIIDAPLVCDETSQTSDTACIYPDGSFMILGRKDSVVNSGGIKIQAEEVEKLFRPFIPASFAITSVPGQRLGQAVTLLSAGQPNIEEIGNKLQETLEPYYRPEHILTAESILQAENGKIGRVECRNLV